MKLIRYQRTSSSWLSSNLLPLLLATASPVQANAEKVIFTAPAPVVVQYPLASTTVTSNLNVLGPDTQWAIRTNLSRVFPTAAYQRGLPAWLLLDNLTEGQRYELRVCWSALEPTSFTLDVYPLDTVLQTPDLLQSLNEYASSRQTTSNQTSLSKDERKTSALLLRVLAAADYFSHDTSLMKDPPPVLVDLILDPYLYNILPRSLLPTAGYIIIVGIIAWFVAQYCASSLISIASSGGDDEKKRN